MAPRSRPGLIAAFVLVTHAGDLLRGPWLGKEWDPAAAAVMLGLLLVSTVLTMWRIRSEESM